MLLSRQSCKLILRHGITRSLKAVRCSLTAVAIVLAVLAVVYLAQYVHSLPSGGTSIDGVHIVEIRVL